MTIDIAAIAARLAAIMPGVWHILEYRPLDDLEAYLIETVDETQEGVAAGITVARLHSQHRYSSEDAEFIAAAPADIAALLAHVAALEAERNTLRQALAEARRLLKVAENMDGCYEWVDEQRTAGNNRMTDLDWFSMIHGQVMQALTSTQEPPAK